MLTNEDLQAIDGLIDKRIKPVHKKLNKLQKDMDTVVRVFDSNIVDLEKRIDKIETTIYMSS